MSAFRPLLEFLAGGALLSGLLAALKLEGFLRWPWRAVLAPAAIGALAALATLAVAFYQLTTNDFGAPR